MPYLIDYIHELAHFLGLNGYVFRLDAHPPDAEDWARIHVEDYNEATIGLGAKFYTASPAEKTQVLIHELCHVGPVRIVEPLSDSIDFLLDLVPKSHSKIAKSAVKSLKKVSLRAEEQHVNTLAVVLAKYAPKWDPPDNDS